MAYLKFPNNIDSTEALILAYMYINCTSACLENQAYDSKHKTVLGKTTLWHVGIIFESAPKFWTFTCHVFCTVLKFFYWFASSIFNK